LVVSFPSLSLEEIAERANRLLIVDVIEVSPPTLNTVDGRFPTEDELREFGVTRLVVHMDVLVRIVETSSAADPRLVLDPGDELVVNVGGGSFRTILTQRQALAVGIREEGDVEFEWGHQTGACLTEGDHLALLLVDFSVPGYLTPDQPRTGVVHPGGVLTPWVDGLWLDPQTGDPVDLHELKILGRPFD
jgi:hypothetical protein